MSLEYVSPVSLECFVAYVLDWFTTSPLMNCARAKDGEGVGTYANSSLTSFFTPDFFAFGFYRTSSNKWTCQIADSI